MALPHMLPAAASLASDVLLTKSLSRLHVTPSGKLPETTARTLYNSITANTNPQPTRGPFCFLILPVSYQSPKYESRREACPRSEPVSLALSAKAAHDLR